jgi:hypothetical protein
VATGVTYQRIDPVEYASAMLRATDTELLSMTATRRRAGGAPRAVSPGSRLAPTPGVGAKQAFSYSTPPVLLAGLHAMPGFSPIVVRKSRSSLGICPQDCA